MLKDGTRAVRDPPEHRMDQALGVQTDASTYVTDVLLDCAVECLLLPDVPLPVVAAAA